ncbi:uncharacterized protein [Malus domestica]|uniref:uncharacterized protein n=1 Tax=Malus domestica TaxID=3750 RepID=UPI003974C46D
MHDHSLMLLITATLSSYVISCVIGSKSSQEIWVRLQNQFFFPSTKTSIIKLQTNLYNIKNGSNSISQYLQRIKEVRDGLSIIGVTFADEDFVIIALNGLLPKYNTFKCVLRGCESIISLKDFCAQLLAEEAIVDCALVECEKKCSFFLLFSSQFHASFNGGYHAQSNSNSWQSSYGDNVDSYTGILDSLPSSYPSSLPPAITTCQTCSHKDHLAAHCSAHTTNSSITQDPNLLDQLQVLDTMESIETDSIMVNSLSHYLESSLPLNSATGASISASKQNDRDEMFLHDAKKKFWNVLTRKVQTLS